MDLEGTGDGDLLGMMTRPDQRAGKQCSGFQKLRFSLGRVVYWNDVIGP